MCNYPPLSRSGWSRLPRCLVRQYLVSVGGGDGGVGSRGGGGGGGGGVGEPGGLHSLLYAPGVRLASMLPSHVDPVVLGGVRMAEDVLLAVVPEAVEGGDGDPVLGGGLVHCLPEHKVAIFSQALERFTVNPGGKFDYHCIFEGVRVIEGFLNQSQGL